MSFISDADGKPFNIPLNPAKKRVKSEPARSASRATSSRPPAGSGANAPAMLYRGRRSTFTRLGAGGEATSPLHLRHLHLDHDRRRDARTVTSIAGPKVHA
jgi:hypothetical protein